MKHTTLTRSLGIFSLVVALAGCTAITDAERFQGHEDFVLELRAFTPHLDQLFEARLVEVDETASVVARAIVDTLPEPEYVIVFEQALRPGRSYRVDFYADANMNRAYDPPDTDHTWREVVPESGEVVFVHNFTFQDIEAPDDPTRFPSGALRVNIRGLEVPDEPPSPAEVEVFFADGRQVGSYFLRRVVDGTVDIVLPGIIDSGSPYDVTVEIEQPGGTVLCDITRTAGADLVIEGVAGDFCIFEAD